MSDLKTIAQNAKKASLIMASLSSEMKNKALLAIAENISQNKALLLAKNKMDLVEAGKMIQQGTLTRALYERLKLDDEKIRVMVEGIKDVAKLDDPVNQTIWAMQLDDGFDLHRVSCPIGAIGVIFESRPDVVPQIASLAIKSANAVILKGGSEANNSNKVLFDLITEALDKVEGFPKNAVNLIYTREDVSEMLNMDEYIDLIIPRGSNNLVKFIQANTKIPVLGHTEGICHIYVDDSADYSKTEKICLDAKIQYPSACNSVETILVNGNVAREFLPKLVATFKKNGVEVKGDEIVKNFAPSASEATEEDWATEYGDKIVSIKVVKDLIEAIEHINKYGSGHTDAIITENEQRAKTFMNLVDSSGVYHNASTRFADGFRYGFGAEVGISTNKTHARGPVGLEGIMIYKYKLFGNGQTVGEYSGTQGKKFTHKRLK